MEPVANPPTQSPVDRARRFYFVSRLVAFCLLVALSLVIAVGLGYLTPAAYLVEIYISGLLGTATAISLAYIGGSVVDYNGGIGNMLRRDRPQIDLPPPREDEQEPRG